MKKQPIDNESFMNLVSLFESKQIDSIALGLQLVESQNCQEQFEGYFKMSFDNYKNVFDNVVLEISMNNHIHMQVFRETFLDAIFNINLDLDKLDKENVIFILILLPNKHKYFNLTNLSASEIASITNFNAEILDEIGSSVSGKLLELGESQTNRSVELNSPLNFIKYLDLNKLSFANILKVLKEYPELIYKFNEKTLDDTQLIVGILRYQPQLIEKLNYKRLLETSSVQIDEIISHNPQLASYFNK